MSPVAPSRQVTPVATVSPSRSSLWIRVTTASARSSAARPPAAQLSAVSAIGT
nr:hypothetical protein [Jiangella endophytica]